MTPEQIVILQSCYEQMMPAGPQMATGFYDRLFTLEPALRPLFHADLEMQKQKFIAMVNTAINGLWFPEALVPVLHHLGWRHRLYGVHEAHYALVADVFLWTVRQELGAGYTPEVAAAWEAAITFLADNMLVGAALLAIKPATLLPSEL